MIISVDAALERVSSVGGELVEVAGLLTWEFEEQSLRHIPRADRGEHAELWLEVDRDTVVDEEQLLSWHGRHVIATGILQAPDPDFGGCGHLSMWPAQLLVRSVRRE